MSDLPPLIQATGLTKIFPGAVVLNDVDFLLEHGEIHALLGENGAGKSTLIKCLTGVYQRDGGVVLLDGQPIRPRNTLDAQNLGIGTVYQEVNLLSNMTVAENLYLGRQPLHGGMISQAEMRKKATALMGEYGINIDVGEDLGSYSVAIQQIVAIARAVDLSGKVLILDEPTASLDPPEVKLLFDTVRRLKERGLGIIFISHFLDQVYEISDTITVLRNGKRVASRATAGLDQRELVAMMLGRELDETPQYHASTHSQMGDVRIAVKGFGKKGKILPFDLEIHKGEAVGMAGLLGSGRTETAETLFGISPADKGKATLAGKDITLSNPRSAIRQGFGFCPEDRKEDGIIADLSLRENIILALQARRGWTRPIPRKEQMAIADKYIKALDIRTTDQEKTVGELSGGNQQKAILARWLATNPDFLILDEPTRGIDVGAHAEIIRLIQKLCDEGISLLVISSELEELTVYSHRIIVVRDHRHVAELVGDDINTSRVIDAIAQEGATPGPIGAREGSEQLAAREPAE